MTDLDGPLWIKTDTFKRVFEASGTSPGEWMKVEIYFTVVGGQLVTLPLGQKPEKALK